MTEFKLTTYLYSFAGVGTRSYSSNVETKKEAHVPAGTPEYEEKEKLTASHNRFIYPEFLPDPDMKFRNPIREKIERQDMLNRRYVSSLDPYNFAYVCTIKIFFNS